MTIKKSNSKAYEILKHQNVKDEKDQKIQNYVDQARKNCKDDIQKFELWIEYLKRSSVFKDVCQWFEEARNNHPYPPSLKEYKHKLGYIEDYLVFTSNYKDLCSLLPFFPHFPLKHSLSLIDKKREHFKISGLPLGGDFFDWAIYAGFPEEYETETLMNLFVFGNIYKSPEQITLLRILFLIESRKSTYALELDDIFNLEFQVSDNNQSFFDDRPATNEEKFLMLKKLLSDFYLPIGLPNPHDNKDKTIEVVKDIIDKRRSELSKIDKKKFESFKLDQFEWPTGNIRIDELERYLKAYDLKRKGKTNKEIAKIFYPEYDLSDADLNATALRYVSRDLSKARKIIKNVEIGYFPGKYQ
jgi:hypothetical protein